VPRSTPNRRLRPTRTPQDHRSDPSGTGTPWPSQGAADGKIRRGGRCIVHGTGILNHDRASCADCSGLWSRSERIPLPHQGADRSMAAGSGVDARGGARPLPQPDSPRPQHSKNHRQRPPNVAPDARAATVNVASAASTASAAKTRRCVQERGPVRRSRPSKDSSPWQMFRNIPIRTSRLNEKRDRLDKTPKGWKPIAGVENQRPLRLVGSAVVLVRYLAALAITATGSASSIFYTWGNGADG